jgi:hypothetical protein
MITRSIHGILRAISMECSHRAWMPAAALLVLLGTKVPTLAAQPVAPPPATPVGDTTSETGEAANLPALPPASTPPNGTSTSRNPRQFGESPLATGLSLKPAPFEGTDVRFPINLATALRLSDARPLIVAAAQASVWVAEAELFRAKLYFIPTLNIGFDYVRHDGGGPDFNKGIMTAPSVNFFYGGGGLTGTLSSTDALFQPLVARQVPERSSLEYPSREKRCPSDDG